MPRAGLTGAFPARLNRVGLAVSHGDSARDALRPYVRGYLGTGTFPRDPVHGELPRAVPKRLRGAHARRTGRYKSSDERHQNGLHLSIRNF